MELCPFSTLDPHTRLASERARTGQGLEPRALLFRSVFAVHLLPFLFKIEVKYTR